MDIRPIKSEKDYRAALAEVETLMGAAADTEDGDRLDVLVTLIEAYEEKNFPIAAPDPIAAIEFRMEQQELTRRDLEPVIGTRARVAEVLNRKRPLTLSMIRGLSRRLGIPADVLIAEYKLNKAKGGAPRAATRAKAGKTVPAKASKPASAEAGGYRVKAKGAAREQRFKRA